MSISPSDSAQVAAIYFDGRVARAHDVMLTARDDALHVSGSDIDREYAWSSARISEAIGSAPRLIYFSDGTHCEVRDLAALASVLAACGHRENLAARFESRWRWALLAVLVVVATVFSAYRWGLPIASNWLAFWAPSGLLAKIDEQTLPLMDRAVFAPTKLSPQRQQALTSELAAVSRSVGRDNAPTLLFRGGGQIGANAMALPGGSIVVTDELLALADNDDEVLAVLAHELGHVERRHSLRMLIEGSIVAFAVSWYIGDVSSVAAGIPTLLLQTRYSRDHEREADAYAAGVLKRNGKSGRLLATMLQKLEGVHDRRSQDKKSANTKVGEADGDDESVNDYFSSHPATRERIEALNQPP